MQRKPKYKVYGINDDTDTCEVCGKTNLKRVIWLMPLDAEGNEVAAQPMPVGTDCAGRMMGWSFSRQKTEAKLQDMFAETKKAAVNAKLLKVTEWFGAHEGVFLPSYLIKAVATGQMTKMEAVAQRNERWPIMKYTSGKITLDEAYALAQ